MSFRRRCDLEHELGGTVLASLPTRYPMRRHGDSEGVGE